MVSKKADVRVRVNTQSLPLFTLQSGHFPLLQKATALKRAGTIGSWRVLIPGRDETTVEGRLCALRKPEEAIQLAQEKLRRMAAKKGRTLQPETLEYAK